MLDDRPEAAKRSQQFGCNRWKRREAFLQGRQDLDSLDRIDPEIGVELHVEIEHLGRIAGLFGNDVDHDRGKRAIRGDAIGIAGAGGSRTRGAACSSDSSRSVALCSSVRRARRGDGPARWRHCRDRTRRAPSVAARRAAWLVQSAQPGAGEPSKAHDSRCSCSSSFMKVCCVFSWPSRNWRCSAAVCSASRCKCDQALLAHFGVRRRCRGRRRSLCERRAACAGRRTCEPSLGDHRSLSLAVAVAIGALSRPRPIAAAGHEL